MPAQTPPPSPARQGGDADGSSEDEAGFADVSADELRDVVVSDPGCLLVLCLQSGLCLTLSRAPWCLPSCCSLLTGLPCFEVAHRCGDGALAGVAECTVVGWATGRDGGGQPQRVG